MRVCVCVCCDLISVDSKGVRSGSHELQSQTPVYFVGVAIPTSESGSCLSLAPLPGLFPLKQVTDSQTLSGLFELLFLPSPY